MEMQNRWNSTMRLFWWFLESSRKEKGPIITNVGKLSYSTFDFLDKPYNFFLLNFFQFYYVWDIIVLGKKSKFGKSENRKNFDNSILMNIFTCASYYWFWIFLYSQSWLLSAYDTIFFWVFNWFHSIGWSNKPLSLIERMRKIQKKMLKLVISKL